jgi:two-component system nitrogen regulation sensor histidine kinase GlnL
MPEPGSVGYYEELLYSLSEGILVFDADSRLVGMNRAASELFRLRQPDAVGALASDIFTGENHKLCELIDRTTQTGRSHTGMAIEYLCSDMTRVPAEISAVPMSDAEGAVVGATIVVREASRIRELEEEVKKSERLAYLGTMAASVAHELRNPLGGIRGASQLLREEVAGIEKEDVFAEYLDVIIRQVDRLTGILDSLKGLSRPVRRSTGPVNLHSLLDEALTLFSTEIKAKKLKVVRDYDPSIPEPVGDENGLSGVFINLIKNAVEAMDKSGVLTLKTGIPIDFLYSTVKTERGKKVMISVSVSDTGPGIADDDLKDIFNPFYSTKGGGLGLGLALSLKVIEEHGGTIKVDTKPAEGTSFNVFLPVYL